MEIGEEDVKQPSRFKLARDEWERDYIFNAVTQHQGNLYQTALYLGMHVDYFKKKYKSLKRTERVRQLERARMQQRILRNEDPNNRTKEVHNVP